MSGSTPNVVIILLAVATYGSLAILIMRFALRATRGPEAHYTEGEGARTRLAGDRAAQPVLAALDRNPALDNGQARFPPLPPHPDAPPEQTASQAG